MSSLRSPALGLGVLAVLVLVPNLSRAQCELEVQEFTPPDGQAGDAFGYRIARQGDLAVMAAPFDDDLGLGSGSAYVYERDPVAGWVLSAKLLPSDGAAGDSFSYSVAIAGGTILVGAPGHDADRGIVYAFERDGLGAWRERARFKPRGAQPGAQFGYALASEGERFLVGMPSIGQPVAGAAFLYRRDRTSLRGWSLELGFTAEDPATALAFGSAVALADDVLAVSGSTESHFPYSGTYVVHVRERDAGGPGNWSEVRSIASSTGNGDIFGYKLALDGKTLAVVAPGEWNPQTNQIGALYLYSRGEGGAIGWGLARRLHSPEAADGLFTVELAVLAGDWLLAALPTKQAGSLHVFGRNVGGPETWGEVSVLQDPELAEGAGYGQGVALEGDELMVAASGYEQSDRSGEVYVYDLSRLARSEWRGDSLGVDVDSYNAGRALLGETFVATVDLTMTGHPLAVLKCFTDEAEIPLPGGQVVLGRNACLTRTSSGPLARFEIPIPNLSSLCGRRLVTQVAHVGGGLPLVLSSAQDVVIGVR
jgi:hypothetical protein